MKTCLLDEISFVWHVSEVTSQDKSNYGYPVFVA